MEKDESELGVLKRKHEMTNAFCCRPEDELNRQKAANKEYKKVATQRINALEAEVAQLKRWYEMILSSVNEAASAGQSEPPKE